MDKLLGGSLAQDSHRSAQWLDIKKKDLRILELHFDFHKINYFPQRRSAGGPSSRKLQKVSENSSFCWRGKIGRT